MFFELYIIGSLIAVGMILGDQSKNVTIVKKPGDSTEIIKTILIQTSTYLFSIVFAAALSWIAVGFTFTAYKNKS